MAMKARLSQLIGRLIEVGRIYHGQPSENLEATLTSASRLWKTVAPGGVPRPWGEGPNEDLVSMLAEARSQLYGHPVSWEQIEEMGIQDPGLWEAACEAMKS